MFSGKLRNKIRVYSLAKTQDVAGGIVSSETTKYNGWASIEPMKADEISLQQKETYKQYYKIKTRYVMEIEPTDEIEDIKSAKKYELISVQKLGNINKEFVLIGRLVE